jgi:polysaccharide deacetylase family protein (PEP-CTERM system associated)
VTGSESPSCLKSPALVSRRLAPPPAGPILNAFTVDVEDYFHVSGFADRISPKSWDKYECRVVRNTHRILSLLNRQQVRGTFFVLGWVAERYPMLVRDIQKAGHEIACHSYWHRLIYDMTPEEFTEDLTQCQKTLEEITGDPVIAHRAPSFSITSDSLWALDRLVMAGFIYDSSIFPIRHDRYGIPGAERFPSVISRPSGDLLEFPPSVSRRFGLNIPVSGGGYFRFLPLQLTIRWLHRINQRDHYPFVFYIHPWELDPDQPRLPATGRTRVRHYTNLATTEFKLKKLLEHFRFSSLSDVMSTLQLEPAAGVATAPRIDSQLRQDAIRTPARVD